MKIDNEILYSLIECDYKGYLKYSGIVDKKYDFEEYLESKRIEYKHKFKENYNTKNLKRKFKVEDFSKNDIIGEVNFCINNFGILSDFVKIVEDKVTGKLIAVPMFIFPREKLTQKERQYLSFIISILSKQLSYISKYAIAVYGKEQKQTKIYYKEHSNENNRLIGKLDNIKNIELFRNRKCSQCGYDQYCLNIAKEQDMLCLVSGITKNDIRKKNEKGIFSLTQMSYTFRPRRNRAKRKAVNKKRNIELQALTLRENRVHIYEYPEISKKATELFLDIEGLPDEGFHYLIGVVTKQNGNIDYKSFWADKSEEELKIFERFIDFTLSFDDFVVYHYGQYELKALNKHKAKLNITRQKQLDKIVSCSVDILRTLSASVYFPVYNYSLKEISKFIGFKWSSPKASGLQSIVWRKKWEELLEEKFKNYLLTYNSEDCKALIIIRKYLDSFGSSNEDIVKPESLIKKRFSLNFLIGEYSLPEIEVIHKHSSFDYQKEHVFVKTNNGISKHKRKTSNKRRRKYPYNILVEKKSLKCPVCKSKSHPLNSTLKKKVVDLKIKPTGIKRWVTQYFTYPYYCPNCKKSYIPKSYLNIKYKYGHSLVCYTIHQNIVNHESFRQISSNFNNFFDLEIGTTTLNDFKIRFAQYYRKGFVQLENEILQSKILYVDETPINMRFEKGYIWVLSNGYDVICYYQPNREAEFIRTLLSNFKGILVSDFYSAYDGVDCIHQKCLLHLIRDLNDDLVRYPYNHEMKLITKSFSTLMQDIVKTIDKRGFLNKFLAKHIPESNNFLSEINQKDFKSEIAIKYQKRFHRYKDKLFTFLKYDNLSWNNNTAEFAIKQLALHRNDNQKYFHKSRIDDYLVSMSLYITCKYREISFLKFLVSGDKIIKAHNNKYT